MPAERLLAKIEAARWYRGQVVHSDRIPSAPSRHATTTLHPSLQTYLDREGIAQY